MGWSHLLVIYINTFSATATNVVLMKYTERYVRREREMKGEKARDLDDWKKHWNKTITRETLLM